MKMRTQLLIANALSIIIILIFLTISYVRMLLPNEAIELLTIVTVAAGILSFFIHGLLIRPIEKAITLIRLESKKIAEGKFEGKVSSIGPKEFQQLAEHFNEMSSKLEESFTKIKQAEASRKELVANISHDLRTPLASIQSFVEALQDDVIEDKQTFDQYLKTIRLETKRLDHLINDLFQLSQLEAGTEAFEPTRYHLDSLIVETLQNQYFQIEEHGLKISVQIPDKLSPLMIMPEKIKRVLINFIQNAIRYAPRGSQLGIDVKESVDCVKVSVTDEGEGINESELPHIFERFYRVEKSRNKAHGGAGLGLAISKSIIDLHGGEIGVQSKQGEGSTFYFTLPKQHK
ncbi:MULTISPECIES: HAMP domain-containing sensor histidine kinase [Bacillaceae]|uniref:sensor histidine kinase n=1 Tax=Bacillaceae TaxID=186817 RepID=UPI001BDE52CB|nr:MULTISPECIES: HAMP domain-containing sensor histidine kinase [Bacillaceae]MDX8365326.1 HAMP domain-containing sensor histidine kinase [Cytobacillus sp. IB215665]